MAANLKPKSVVGMCHNCQERTTFEFTYQGNELSHMEVDHEDPFVYSGFKRVIYQFCRCAVCGAGGLVIFEETNGRQGELLEFYPIDYSILPIPQYVPKGIVSEFREAEKCAGIGAYRAGAAMLRSVLEKTLKDHNYTKWTLTDNLKDAGIDEIIPTPLKQRASQIVKVLGDDVMHKEWREVTKDEFESAQNYIQRILEAFYDYPEEVKKVLKQKGRIIEKAKT